MSLYSVDDGNLFQIMSRNSTKNCLPPIYPLMPRSLHVYLFDQYFN